jgi:hypothetical protein
MGTSVAIMSGASSPTTDPNFQVVQAALGAGAANALPKIPTDPTTALALATKWYTYYFTLHQSDAALTQSGITYWQGQIQQDGPYRAWANFAGSPEPVAQGVEGLAEQLTPVLGNQYYSGPAAATVAGGVQSTSIGPLSSVPTTTASTVNTASSPGSGSGSPASVAAGTGAVVPVNGLPLSSTPIGSGPAPASLAPASPAPAKVSATATVVTPWYETPLGIGAILLAAFIFTKGGKHLFGK